MCLLFFFFKQKTAYEMRISDWSSDVCSSDLSKSLDGKVSATNAVRAATLISTSTALTRADSVVPIISSQVVSSAIATAGRLMNPPGAPPSASGAAASQGGNWTPRNRSEEHTSELQSLMRISYAVFCLKKKNNT